ncbi:CoA-transferase family III [Acephala macrosclerotiorum]|nr:CoA-transferase family III [Acephala macrosclerotiorum]
MSRKVFGRFCFWPFDGGLRLSRQVVPLKSRPRLFSTTSRRSAPEGALHGIKILDMSRVLAGPFCTQILADYGAEVIKVEQPGQGDDTRYWRVDGERAIWGKENNMSCYFAAVNRNKRSITLDVKKAEGKEILLKLVKNADILVENFIPGKMEQFGLGYDVLSKLNPGLIFASISGYGAQGPYSKRAGYDIIAAAEAGLLHITGEQNGPPTKPGVALVDLSTGLYTHGAILAALQARHRTGKGQKIDSSLFETQLSLLTSVATVWLNMQKEATRFGTEHPSIVPYAAFQTKDSWIVCGAVNNRQFKVLVEVLGCPETAGDERFESNDKRIENRDELKVILDRCFMKKTTSEWLSALEGSGMPYGPINNIEDSFKHPQTKARDMMRTVDFEAMIDGQLKMVGIPVKFGDTKISIRRRPPLLGEHTDEILKEIGVENIGWMREHRIV